jgi:hypothetical protein
MALNLSTIIFPPAQDNTAQLLRQMDYKTNTQKYKQRTGLVTSGMLEVVQGIGGNVWGISDLIPFTYEYSERPLFSWGLEGSYSGDLTNTSPTVNSYLPELPPDLKTYIEANDFTTFSPAVFIPRIIHWWKRSELVYSGCFLLVHQVNSACTEPDGKICRIHFRFEGTGYLT